MASPRQRKRKLPTAMPLKLPAAAAAVAVVGATENLTSEAGVEKQKRNRSSKEEDNDCFFPCFCQELV